jgi:hypothetical protein
VLPRVLSDLAGGILSKIVKKLTIRGCAGSLIRRIKSETTYALSHSNPAGN